MNARWMKAKVGGCELIIAGRAAPTPFDIFEKSLDPVTRTIPIALKQNPAL